MVELRVWLNCSINEDCSISTAKKWLRSLFGSLQSDLLTVGRVAVKRHHRNQFGFTIIELLIVIGIIAMLMALILPGLARARMAAQKGQCLSNLYQIELASSIYQDENNDSMPIGKPIRGVSNYNHGGRYPVQASRISRMFTQKPADRPLNRYIYTHRTLGENATTQDLEDYRKFNFPIFHCPADEDFNYQENWDQGKIRYGLSAYLAVGTSYFFNMAWYGSSDWVYNDIAEGYTWGHGIRAFRRARLVYPSRFAAFYDDPADYHISQGKSPLFTHHNVKNQHAMAFLDGHAKMVNYDPSSPNNGSYAVLFPEQLR